MTSNEEEKDIAEKNILFLQRLKSFIEAKIFLNNLKLLQKDEEFRDNSDISVQEKNNIIKSLLETKYLENDIKITELMSFLIKNIITVESEDSQFQEFKQKILHLLKQQNESTEEFFALDIKLRNLTLKHKEVKAEILLLRNNYGESVEKNDNTENGNKEISGSDNNQKKQILLRVEKINLMRSIINGLLNTSKGINWKDNRELLKIQRLCRSTYNLE